MGGMSRGGRRKRKAALIYSHLQATHKREAGVGRKGERNKKKGKRKEEERGTKRNRLVFSSSSSSSFSFFSSSFLQLEEKGGGGTRGHDGVQVVHRTLMAVMTAFLVSPAPGDFHVPSANAGIVCPEARVMVGPPAPTLAFFAAGSDIFGLKDGTSWMYPKRKRCVDDRQRIRK